MLKKKNQIQILSFSECIKFCETSCRKFTGTTIRAHKDIMSDVKPMLCCFNYCKPQFEFAICKIASTSYVHDMHSYNKNDKNDFVAHLVSS